MKIEKLLVNTKLVERFTYIEDVYDNDEIIDLLKELFESNLIRIITGCNDFYEIKDNADFGGINYCNGEIIFVMNNNWHEDMIHVSEEIDKFANNKNIIIDLNNNLNTKIIRFTLFKSLSISFNNIKYNCSSYEEFKNIIRDIRFSGTIELHMNNIEKLC